MSDTAVTTTKQAAAPEAGSKNELRLRRGCDCGQHTPGGHECDDCKKKSATRQRWSKDRPRPAAILNTYERPARGADLGFDLSQVETRTIPQPPADGSAPALQPADTTASQTTSPPTTIAADTASPGDVTTAVETQGGVEQPGSLIADDVATELRPGQVRKTEFLDQLHTAVSSTAETALTGTGRSAVDCPYLSFWFEYYRNQTGEHIERALQRYVPQTRNARSALEYIQPVAEQVHRSVLRWVRTGEVTGVPADAPNPAATQVDAARTTPSGAVQLAARGGGGRPSSDPEALRAVLGAGQPLESQTRSRMEAAFGHDFSAVRTHRDRTASRLASEQNSRAFTVGQHVAFGAGEFRPGTVVGDALIAHELAHVVQQGTGTTDPQAKSGDSEAHGVLEADADRSAAAAVLSLWGRTTNVLRGVSATTAPSLRSGLRLQRCGNDGRVTGNLTVRTSGPLQGGWSVHDYLSGGLSWGNVPAPSTAGAAGKRFKVQQYAPFTGGENLGVSQTMQHGNSNQSFLDGTAAYLGRAPGTVKNGEVYGEPVLNSADPFAATGWNLRYKDGNVSFADVPGAVAGDQGYIDFVTSFHSKAADAQYKRCSATWRWSVDFTAGNTTNTVTTRSQQCT